MNFHQILENLYEGTLDSVAWDRAILAIADAVRASGAILFAFNPGTGALLRNEQHRVDPHAVAEYARYWNVEDIRRNYVFTLPVGQPGTEWSLAIPLKSSRIYNEYMLAVDMPHFMPVWLHKSERKAVAISMQGSYRRGPFSARDMQTLGRFLPHLARTLEIRDRLEAAEIRAASLVSVLDTANFGVLVLDAHRRILESNAIGAALLAEHSALRRDADGSLRLNGHSHDRLARWMQDRLVPESPAEALLRVPRAGKLPLSLLVVPVPRQNIAWISGDPNWLLLIFDPEQRLALNAPVIERDLGLSAREAGVVSLLAAGLPVPSIARRLHVSIHTVRSQLQSAFQKTGCHTQADIVRRVLLGPGSASLV